MAAEGQEEAMEPVGKGAGGGGEELTSGPALPQCPPGLTGAFGGGVCRHWTDSKIFKKFFP